MTHIELRSVAMWPYDVAENVSYGRKCLLRPKMSVAAENGYFRPKIPYCRNFGYGRISVFWSCLFTVTVFRQKISYSHTLYAA